MVLSRYATNAARLGLAGKGTVSKRPHNSLLQIVIWTRPYTGSRGSPDNLDSSCASKTIPTGHTLAAYVVNKAPSSMLILHGSCMEHGDSYDDAYTDRSTCVGVLNYPVVTDVDLLLTDGIVLLIHWLDGRFCMHAHQVSPLHIGSYAARSLLESPRRIILLSGSRHIMYGQPDTISVLQWPFGCGRGYAVFLSRPPDVASTAVSFERRA